MQETKIEETKASETALWTTFSVWVSGIEQDTKKKMSAGEYNSTLSTIA